MTRRRCARPSPATRTSTWSSRPNEKGPPRGGPLQTQVISAVRPNRLDRLDALAEPPLGGGRDVLPLGRSGLVRVAEPCGLELNGLRQGACPEGGLPQVEGCVAL